VHPRNSKLGKAERDRMYKAGFHYVYLNSNIDETIFALNISRKHSLSGKDLKQNWIRKYCMWDKHSRRVKEGPETWRVYCRISRNSRPGLTYAETSRIKYVLKTYRSMREAVRSVVVDVVRMRAVTRIPDLEIQYM
jgi:hypothetical protein